MPVQDDDELKKLSAADDDGWDEDEDDEDDEDEVERAISLVNADGIETGRLDGDTANLRFGGGGAEGDIVLLNAAGDQTVHLDGGNGNLTLGGAGSQGDITLLTPDGTGSIHLDGGEGVIRLHGKAVQTADHVFDPAYPLMPLADLAAYVKARGHLPGVPSGPDMVRDGVDVAAQQARLLAQIEELTLRLIDMDDRLRSIERA